MSPEITDSARPAEADALSLPVQLGLQMHYIQNSKGQVSYFNLDNPLEYDDDPIDFTVKSELIAEVGLLMSHAAEVFVDVESTLHDVQFGFGKLQKKDKKYFRKHIARVQGIRETMTDISFSPDVVRGVWTDLINTPTLEKNDIEDASPEETPESTTEVPYKPTPEDVMLVIEVSLKSWVDEARLIMDYVEKHFGKRIPIGNEMDGVPRAAGALMGGRNRINQHLNALPERIRGPLILTGLAAMPTNYFTTGNSKSF